MGIQRASRILSSNLLWRLAHPIQAPIAASSPQRSHLSSAPHRPTRGGGRDDNRRRARDGGDVPSEELFLRSLNFGDEKPPKTQQGPRDPSPAPNMPLNVRRERRPGEASRDIFSDLDSMASEKPGRTQTPDLPPSAEHMEGSDANGRDFEEKFDFFKQRRGENIDTSFKTRDSIAKDRENGRLGDSLFEKLNLGSASRAGKAEGAERKPVADATVAEPLSQDADEIFKKMKETGLIPNAVAMLDGLCKDGLIQDAMKLFGLMREKGTIPEVVIYTAVVEGFCKVGKFDDAMRIFRKMLQNGIEPNAFSYTVLVQGLCKGGRLEDAVEFSMAMLDAGHLLNAATLTALVDGFCREKGLEEAEGVVRRLRDRGFAMDEKAVREHMDKKGPFSKMVWEAIFGKKASQKPF